MKARYIDGTLIGTFNSTVGDQFEQIGAKTDVLYRGSFVNEDNGERIYRVVFRSHEPVDERRLELELPEHGFHHLVSTIEAETE